MANLPSVRHSKSQKKMQELPKLPTFKTYDFKPREPFRWGETFDCDCDLCTPRSDPEITLVPDPAITLVVTGSRKPSYPFVAGEVVYSSLDIVRDYDVLLIHGGAQGIDSIAAEFAHEWGWRVEEHKPDYANYSRSYAPLKRNRDMVDRKPDVVLAYWDGKSRGTKYTIDYAKKKGVPVIVHRLEPAPRQPMIEEILKENYSFHSFSDNEELPF